MYVYINTYKYVCVATAEAQGQQRRRGVGEPLAGGSRQQVLLSFPPR